MIISYNLYDSQIVYYTTNPGIHVVGEGSWKEREIGKSGIGKFR